MLSAVEKRDEILALASSAAGLEQAIQVAESIPDDMRSEILAHAQEISGKLYMVAERFLAPPELL